MTDEMQQRPATLARKRERFVGEYLVDLNAAGAARRAGYSARTARQAGHELLTKPDIQAALTQAQRGRAERLEMTADKVLRDLERRGCAAEGAGQYAAAIRASELQGKHLSMFTDRVEIEARRVLVVPDLATLPEATVKVEGVPLGDDD